MAAVRGRVEMAELVAAVAALPESVRAALAEGPMDETLPWDRGSCGVCRALKLEVRRRWPGITRADAIERLEGLTESDDPLGTVWAFHESQEWLIARAMSRTFIEGEPDAEMVEHAEHVWNMPGAEGSRTRELAGAAGFYRCTIVYLLAGWRPGGG